MPDINIMFYAAGYNYNNIGDEIKSINKLYPTWIYNSKSMEKLAHTANGYIVSGIYSIDELIRNLNEILANPQARLKNMGIICHGTGALIDLKSRTTYLNPNSSKVSFSNSGKIDTMVLEKNSTRIRNILVPNKNNNKIANNALITLYSCYSGLPYQRDENLIQAFADTFQIPTIGFKKAIEVCINTAHEKKAKYKSKNKNDSKNQFISEYKQKYKSKDEDIEFYEFKDEFWIIERNFIKNRLVSTENVTALTFQNRCLQDGYTIRNILDLASDPPVIQPSKK